LYFYFRALLGRLVKKKEYAKTWVGVFTKKNLDQDYSVWQEAQFRYAFNEGSMQQTLLRFGLLKKIDEHHEMGAIMGFVQTGLTKEYRPTFQHVYSTSNSSDMFYSVRSRLEFRDIENDDALSLRYRLLLSARYALTPTLSPMLWNEAFVNSTRESWTGDRFYERNRLFLGLRIDRPTHRWEVGYMNQYIPRQNVDTIEHILMLYLFF
jgi:hypothetical protein